MRGLADALADPETAAATAVELVEANGNPNFLSPEGEAFRWAIDTELLTTQTPEGTGYGIPDAELLQAEVDAYAAVGLFGETGAPDIAPRFDATFIESVYDGDQVIWPG
jgi:NitT/TauT family transport system substrate-binding protein